MPQTDFRQAIRGAPVAAVVGDINGRYVVRRGDDSTAVGGPRVGFGIDHRQRGIIDLGWGSCNLLAISALLFRFRFTAVLLKRPDITNYGGGQNCRE